MRSGRSSGDLVVARAGEAGRTPTNYTGADRRQYPCTKLPRVSGDLPDEWFRARGAARPGDAGSPSPLPSFNDDERFTDQFKPNYIPHEPRAVSATDPNLTGATGETSASQQGSFGENSAGTTYTLGEVRRAPVVAARTSRASRVRRVIQTALLLSVALAIGLVGGSWLASRQHQGETQGGTTQPSASGSASVASADTPYSGPMKAITGVKASAQCTATPKVDDAGRPVSYPVANAIDTNPATAWRCDGPATGVKLTFTLPAGTTLVGMGLVNGYTKATSDGTFLYERYRRVLRVDWTINGRHATQQLTDHRAVEQTITIPPLTVEGPVTLTIQQTSAPGQNDDASNATLISTVTFYTKG